MAALLNLAKKIRYDVARMSYIGKAPHLGSSLSPVELLVFLYWKVLSIDPLHPKDPNRDFFLLSKGHAISVLYSVLSRKGFFSPDLLESFNHDGSIASEHPTPFCVPGLEFATGSLGHGLGVAAGIALSKKIQSQNSKVYALLSDGECNEGSVWEAALFAQAKNLDNLCCIVDFNKWQATGRSEEVLNLSPLKEKWEAFGWNALEIDGHNFAEIEGAFETFKNSKDKPFVIVAHTVKGKGISFMEDDNNWHYRIPSTEEMEQIAEILEVHS